MAFQSTASLRVMIISDTHGKNIWTERGQNPPRVDVVLHCGDLSGIGGYTEYMETMDLLETIDAELKLVIAGNHDLSLDKRHNLADLEDRALHEKCMKLWTGPKADAAGVVFLHEGTYRFTLKSGATFSIYATPFTPKFGDWAFSYGKNKDRFSGENAKNPVGDEVDIMMTHGPAYGYLDQTAHGDLAGCKMLAAAVARVQPKIHCFGHIHEGYGAEIVSWSRDGNRRKDVAGQEIDGLRNVDVRSIEKDQTLLVNAAMLDEKHECGRAPWIIDMQTDKKEPPAVTDDDYDDDEDSEDDDDSDEEDSENDDDDDDSDEESEDADRHDRAVDELCCCVHAIST